MKILGNLKTCGLRNKCGRSQVTCGSGHGGLQKTTDGVSTTSVSANKTNVTTTEAASYNYTDAADLHRRWALEILLFQFVDP